MRLLILFSIEMLVYKKFLLYVVNNYYYLQLKFIIAINSDKYLSIQVIKY